MLGEFPRSSKTIMLSTLIVICLLNSLVKIFDLSQCMLNRKVLVQGSFNDCLGRLEEGVWVVSSCIT